MTPAGEHVKDAAGGSPGAEADIRPRVLLFYDYTCPFCYIDQFRFDELRHEFEIDLVPVPHELRPDVPPEGISAAEHGLTHTEHVEARLLELAEAAGHPMVLPDLVPNTHLAMAMAEYARDFGDARFWRVHQAIFAAYFSEGRDIGRREVLLGVARAEGLDAEAVTRAWDKGTYDGRLHEFLHLALHLGIKSTPSALICNELLIGTRPYGVLREAVQRCLITAATLEDEAESPAVPEA